MSESTEHVVVEVKDGVCAILFNRAEKKNAFTHAMYTACVDAIKAAEANPAVRVISFTGAGAAYTSGNDLFDFMNNPPSSDESPVLLFLHALNDAKKPIVCAVNGLAIGIGVTMLLHCDLVYASDAATFKMPFVALGLVPEGASSLLLPRMAGHALAAEALLIGEAFGAARAEQLGLVTRVVPAAELADVARAQCAKLAALPPASVRASKALMKGHGQQQRTRDAIMAEAVVFAERLGSPEAMEAFQSFFEKRKPDFSKFE
jgi:enoyl-CoA hydratase/carnithine racemase